MGRDLTRTFSARIYRQAWAPQEMSGLRDCIGFLGPPSRRPRMFASGQKQSSGTRVRDVGFAPGSGHPNRCCDDGPIGSQARKNFGSCATVNTDARARGQKRAVNPPRARARPGDRRQNLIRTTRAGCKALAAWSVAGQIPKLPCPVISIGMLPGRFHISGIQGVLRIAGARL